MKCLRCGCTDDKVIDSRIVRDGEAIRRRRQCIKCEYRFTTYESIIKTEAVIIKRDGGREDFNPEKLRQGVRHACWKRPVSEIQIDEMVSKIGTEIEAMAEREISSQYVGELVMNELRKVDHVAYVRFASVYRRFEDIGEFVNEIKNLTKRNSQEND